MVSPAYEQILDVQALDLRMIQLRHRLASHPGHAEVAATTEGVAAAQGLVGTIEERRHGLERDLKRLSDEVDLLDARISEVEAKLYDGSVTASKELLALQDEIASLKERKVGLEDQELEIMEAAEEVDGELGVARNRLQEVEAARDQATATLAQAMTEIEGEITEVGAERVAAAEPANPVLLARYEELAPQYDGVPVARFTDGRCDGCHIQLSAVAVDQLTKAPPDAVVTCEECGRLLVR